MVIMQLYQISVMKKLKQLIGPCSSAVSAADPSGDGGVPEEARRVLRGPEAVPEERLCSERLLPVSLVNLFH